MLNKKRAVFVLFLVALLILILLSFSIVFAKSEKSEENNKVSSDPICKYIKFQNESMFDNATLQLCERQKEELKKALGKGKMKKPKGIEIRENRIIESAGKATIKFKDSFNVDSEEVEEESGNANIYIGEGIVAVNTEELPELEQPATITLYNLSFENTPTIYYSEEFTTRLSEVNTPCPSDVCSNINYDNMTGTLTFDVTHFSSYAPGAWAINPYNYIYSWPYSTGVCSVDADCKPTAYCSKEVNCVVTSSDTTTQHYSYYGSNDLSDSVPRYTQRCNYKPAAGTENSTCSLYTRYSRPCSLELNNYCEEGYTYKEEKGGSYGDSWCMDICEKTETCGTCDGTDACTKSYCSYNAFNPCCNQGSTGLCTTGDWSNCIKQARESCLTSNVYTGSPDTYFCKPKVCQSPTKDIGKCFESVIVNNITTNYSIGIGGPFCSDRNIKVCNNQNNDPCGEWEQTSIGCNAERNETEKKCYDNTGTTQDYCSSQEILNKYSPLSGQVYNISLTDMYGYHSSSWWGINYSLNLKVQEQKCNITQINCTKSGMVCNSIKRACNSLPTASTNLAPLNSSAPYVEQGVPTHLSDLNCTITLTDKDTDDKTLYGDYKVTIKYVDDNGNTQLATLMSGQDSCTKQSVNGILSSSCTFQVPVISNTITEPGDIINCSVVPYDGYDYGKSGSDWELIKPNVILTVDQDYLTGKNIDIDEYLKPVEIEENGQLKDYLVVTEYDTMECSAKNPVPTPLRTIEFELLGARKTVQCGNECKAKFEIGEGKDIAALPRGQKIKCNAKLTELGLSFPSNNVVVAKYVYYFVPINQPYYGYTTEQYDYFTKLSQVNDRINLAGKAVYLKQTSIAPTTGLARELRFLSRIKNVVKNNVLNGDFDEEKDIITGIATQTITMQICTGSTACAASFLGPIVLISKMDFSEPTIAHEFGHIIGKNADEYKLSKWRAQYLRGSYKSPLGEDSTLHFPKCCLWVCCKELTLPSNSSSSTLSLRWRFPSDCDALIWGVPYMNIVSDALCNNVSLPTSSCGTVEDCKGMPYKDKEGNQPFDESYHGERAIGSIMGSFGYLDLIYPQNSKCPLRNC